MKRRRCLAGVFVAVFLLLSALRWMGVGEGWAALADDEKGKQRYHPNGSEPVYVGIFKR